MTKRTTLMITMLVVVLAACETTVEPGEMAIQEGVCPRPHNQVSGPSANQDWGTVTPVQDGIEYTVNAGFTATLCAKGGPNYSIITVTGPESGFLQTPTNAGGNIPDLSHWSVTNVTGSAVGTTTTVAPTTTLATTTTTAAETTTSALETTTTAPDSPTTTEDTSDLTLGTTTTLAGATTTTLAGGATTTLAGEVTTTEEIGSGTLESETTTTAEVGAGTLDPDETTTTAEVGAGSDTDTTLPYTGSGDITMGGLAAILLLSGTALLLLARRRSSEG